MVRLAIHARLSFTLKDKWGELTDAYDKALSAYAR
jgi:hypothetical protein